MPHSVLEIESIARQHREELIRDAERPRLTRARSGGWTRLRRQTGIALIAIGERLGGHEPNAPGSAYPVGGVTSASRAW